MPGGQPILPQADARLNAGAVKRSDGRRLADCPILYVQPDGLRPSTPVDGRRTMRPVRATGGKSHMTEQRPNDPVQARAGGWRMRRIVPLALLGVLLAIVLATGLDSFLSLDSLRAHRDELAGFVDRHPVLAPLAYMLFYTVIVALSLPGALLLTIVGGFLFGSLAGTAWTVLGATAGATIVFLAARHAFGDVLRARAGQALGRLEAGFRRNAFSYLLFLRLMPVFPFFIINLVPAFLDVRVRTFVAATLLGIVPGTFVYAQLGLGLESILRGEGEIDLADLLTPEIIIALACLSLLALLPVVVKRLRRTARDA